MIEDCTAIILAGGDSRRMGRDKAGLVVGNRTLLQQVAAAMGKVFPEVIVSVRRLRKDIDLPQVCDGQADQGQPPGAGPLAGVMAGLGCLETTWAFVVACDMPFVQPAMVELLGSYREHHQAVVPVVQGHRQTLAAYYARSCLDTIQAHLAAGGKNSLRAVLEKLQVR